MAHKFEAQGSKVVVWDVNKAGLEQLGTCHKLPFSDLAKFFPEEGNLSPFFLLLLSFEPLLIGQSCS